MRYENLADDLVLYTHPDCSYSAALKQELIEQGTEFCEVDLALRPDQWEVLENLTGGERTTPVSVEGKLVTVGYHGVG